jgi:hypothetical protein
MNTADLPHNVAKLRLAFAAGTLLTPKAMSVAVGLRPREANMTAGMWARLFASREAALGAMTLGAGSDAAARKRILLINAAVDGVDAVMATLVARKTRSLRLFALAVPGAVASSVGHFLAAQQLAAEV